ncbi:carbon storage regulator CsrA [Campylobacter sp. RM9344]|uniref:Translational regulator CsrA n=1 Tax=Campylobacter californiensis TaxID=1032243 RepID=A0AAW3ZUW7_9BACT|nr:MULTISPECIES: carbon storage regulator CsrA [unclassified Campylobacter]MBE2983951.1 carbon storage regulator CsrA [Campylobacter sp. RM6883]MBE2986113.1 carbon storage regulator CsrA [Campylobacter sp. RM12919]MBE2987526.1 carbon storage regulator CsrA [Campylobacter sp. RM12920]MBE2994489.1 carbon storage regulator CsrA [Campylobacter sp. RM6913]MBE3022483.1 carbon storage regulator CsrA [Campylobacter sp. 7477a]MBE3028797.1 carbon storage regulator CsrA [Campylobacter sp. RM9344]
MLILSRKENEEILLGNDIKITVVSISKSGVKIGIEAPKNMMILRSELSNEIKAKNTEASKHASDENLTELSKKIEK